jgi:enoyl-CoA hydratase
MTVQTFGHVTVERQDDLAVVRIDHRDSRMNTISLEVVDGLRDAARALTDQPSGAVVFTGNDRLFSAGAEISEFERGRIGSLGRRFHEAFDAIAAIPRMTIAAVRRYALGAACELILACDLRVMADNARIAQPEIQLGVIPGGGGTQRLPRLVGPSIAKDIICSGRHVDAEEALRIGLVNRVVPEADLEATALALAAGFGRGAVHAQQICKRLIDGSLDSGLGTGLEAEKAGWGEAFDTEDARIGIESFFANGAGKARFVGR